METHKRPISDVRLFVYSCLINCFINCVFYTSYGINVTSISADGDARLLTSMKHSYIGMINQMSSDVLINLNREQQVSFIQDIIHVATKLRNRYQKHSILLPMGSKLVSVTYLKILIDSVAKEIHELVYTDICPEDRQHFSSFEKVTEDRVLMR